MSVSAAEQRRVCLKSGNRCAFGTCRRLLSAADPASGELVVLGEIAHIVASKETIEDLRACPHKWCVIPYRGARGIWLDQSLGCTKLGAFSFEFRLELDGHPFPLEDWRRLDVRIANLLRAHRIQRHVHGLSVEHRHIYT
jgi:hypothetical protein